jgi:hypothetical protein
VEMSRFNLIPSISLSGLFITIVLVNPDENLTHEIPARQVSCILEMLIV